MKAAIHPEYFKAKVTCACGAVLETHSTRGSFSTDVCSTCHPFYTGKQKLMDTAGRVDRFRRKYATQSAEKQAADKLSAEKSEKAAADKEAAAAAPVEAPAE